MTGKTMRRSGVAKIRALFVLFGLAALVLGSGAAPGRPVPAAYSAVPAQTLKSQRPGDSTSGDTTCVPAGTTGTTCSNTYSGETGWDWSTNPSGDGVNPWGAQSGVTPTVTVDQTSNLLNQMVHVSWTGFTPSMLSEPNAPAGWGGGYAQGKTSYGVAVFECAGTDPQDLAADCNITFTNQNASTTTAAPNAVDSYTLAGASVNNPGDCTIDPDPAPCGTGYTDFQVQTSVQNSALGCDATTPCSIVVEPLWGGNASGIAAGEPDACDDHTNDYTYGNGGDYGLDNQDSWYSPCSWQDRMVVPITFAPTERCASNGYQFTAEGAPDLERVMDQWQPAWCNAKQNQVDFDFDSGVDEYQARSDFLSGSSSLTASTDAALVTDPAPAAQASASSRQFTYAPIADTGIVIAYYVDDTQTDQPVTDLKLNARLVAKLLTESYSVDFDQCTAGQTVQSDTCDPGVEGNPRDIFDDPEFLALNPQYTASDFGTSAAANSGDFLPIVLAGNSDMTYELTRWVESDPEARAFLEGQVDPWGMHVNTYYEQGQSYPISQFEVLDPGYTLPPSDYTQLGGKFPYNVTMQDAWNPVTGLDAVATQLTQWTGTALAFEGSCNDPNNPEPPCKAGVSVNNPKSGPEDFAQRGLFAVMDQGTAAAYRLPTAQLVNSAGNAEGPTFAAETAALNAMQTNPDKITQYQNYSDTSPNAYPLTEVQYAMVPTCGLSATSAQAVSAFLHDAAGSQFYGTVPGDIPPFGGYLALDDTQKAQTLTAAQQVSSQTCTSPPPDTTVSGGTPSSTTGSSGGLTSGGVTPTAGATASSAASATPRATVSAPDAEPVALGQKSAEPGGMGRILLPIALILGALLLLGGPLVYAYGSGALRLPASGGGGLRSAFRRGSGGAAPPDPDGPPPSAPDSAFPPFGDLDD